jgi:hypothetical protein
MIATGAKARRPAIYQTVSAISMKSLIFVFAELCVFAPLRETAVLKLTQSR